MNSIDIPFNQPQPLNSFTLYLPLAVSKVRAGFPSPADDFACTRIDLGKELVKHQNCTFILRVSGDSMEGAGIFNDDLIVVDKYLKPESGDIVVAVVDGEFTCKRLILRPGQVILKAENPTYPDIRFKDEQTLEIWGVVTSAVKRFRKL